jgi:L-malate glycosyltransferase
VTQAQYRVAIVQETIPHYRVPFFADLRKALTAQGVTLALLYGRPTDEFEAAQLRLALPWARAVDLHVVSAKGMSAVYQPVVRLTAGADLVIVEQANRMLSNYALLARQARGGPGVAFWGHGANLQAGDGSLAKISEQWKRTYSTRPHWWFAYTEGSAERVHALGFGRDRITVVQNAVDTAWAKGVADVEREPGRCVYVGRLYKEKRIDFLVEAGDEVITRVPDFQLVVLGDGPERAHLEELAKTRPWLKIRGTVVGHAKAVELAKASLHLMPGLVGLGVVDSFATQTPLVTIERPQHGPEAEYLDNGTNGVLMPVDTTPAEYGSTVAELLTDERALRRLRTGCRRAAKKYTLDAMVDHFASGVIEAVRSSRATPPAYTVARHNAWIRARDFARRAGTKVSRVTTTSLTREHRRPDLVRLGSDYGRSWVPADLIDKYSICYLAGVGEDTTFDEQLIERFGCDVWAFDPTPRAIAHAETVTNRKFHFMDVGLWNEAGTVKFYAPADPTHASYSIMNIQDTDNYIEARVETVAEVMFRLGHTTIDLLKLDIEGAEGPVVEKMLDDGITPTVLCIELDAVEPPWKSLGLIHRLVKAGYEVNHIEDHNYTLTLRDA